jgi:hypothetical protein
MDGIGIKYFKTEDGAKIMETKGEWVMSADSLGWVWIEIEKDEYWKLFKNISKKWLERVNRLERHLLKQSVRLHDSQMQAGLGEHVGSFRECTNKNCRRQKQLLISSDVWKDLEKFFEERDGR